MRELRRANSYKRIMVLKNMRKLKFSEFDGNQVGKTYVQQENCHHENMNVLPESPHQPGGHAEIVFTISELMI
jgi:hypothetical protein